MKIKLNKKYIQKSPNKLWFQHSAIRVLTPCALISALISIIGSANAVESQPSGAITQTPGNKVPADARASASPAAQLNLQQLPNLLDIPQTTESLEKVQKLQQTGETLFTQGLLDQAMAKFQEAYGLSLEMKYALGEGIALTNMCRVFIERGQMIKAKYMGENAIEVLSAVNEHRALGRARLYLAEAYFGLDNPIWAGQQLDLALKEFNADGTNNSADTARLMNLAASVLIKMGKIKEAIQFYQAAATYYGQCGDTVRAVNTNVQITDMLLALGLLAAAAEQADKAISIARAASDQPGLMVGALSSSGNCKYTLGELWQAKKIYEQVYQLIKSLPNKSMNELGRANVDLGYGTTLAALGDYDEALPILEKTLNVFKSNGATLPQAQTANILAVLEENNGHHDKARAYVEQSLDLQNLITPKQDSFRLIVLQNAAVIDGRSGRNRDARARIDQALTSAKRLKDKTAQGRLHLVQAEILLKLAEEAECEKVITSGIAIAEAVNDDATLWQLHTLLAKIQQSQGKAVTAKDHLQSAVSFFRSPQSDTLVQAEKLPAVNPSYDLVEQLVAMLASEKMTEQALLVAEQYKEQSLITAWANAGLQVRPEDQDVYSELSIQRIHLHAAELSSVPNVLVKDWQSWLSRFRSVSKQNRSLARLIAPIPTTSAEIVSAVNKLHATVVDFLLGADSSVVFTVNGSGRTSATVIQVGRKRLESQVAALMSAVPKGTVTNPQAALNEKRILQALSGELLPQSVRAFLPSDPEELVIMIPDGPLHNLPFAALISEQSKYLIESHTLTSMSTIASLFDLQAHYADDFSILLATNSVGNSEVDQAKTIARAFSSDASTYFGKDADLKNLADLVRGKAIMHIAGPLNFGNESNALEVKLPLYDGSKSAIAESAIAERLSGLNLATDCSVWAGSSISAKDTEGHAVRLFTRSLQYAGARNVVIGLWQSPPEEDTSLLLEFYKNRQAGLHYAQSMRKAALETLSKDSAPHAWAGFQLVGSGL